MQTKPILFIVIVLIAATSSNCSRHKTPPVNERCENNIKQASKTLEDKSASLNKTDIQRIQNLIKAAKIQQQYGRFNTCVDKMNRALTLMKQDPNSKTPANISN
ncbi:hypothetical protein MNBD_GAMMA21-1007 [hydrothermal vent metagenome]|uniref:Uncharacterized protein n=1 Tax=hydrothermal vent metagenome TaxID=652676 RepID=A0A3B1A9T7_9ZZZZ